MLGSERIDETFDPGVAMQRAIDLYRAKGYDENWITKRTKIIQDRKKLTDVWQDGGIKEGYEYAFLTNEIYKSWSGMTAKEYKEYKGLRNENLRDSMDNTELVITELSEEATKRITEEKKPFGFKENIQIARKGGGIAKIAREALEEELGKSIITKTNRLDYAYLDEELLENRNGGKND